MNVKGVTNMIIYNGKTMELEFGPEEGSEESIKIFLEMLYYLHTTTDVVLQA